MALSHFAFFFNFLPCSPSGSTFLAPRLGLVTLVLLLLVPHQGQTTTHCPFNQLCTCKYAPKDQQIQRGQTRDSRPDQYDQNRPETSTQTSFQGQFGTITTAGYGEPIYNGSFNGRASRLKPAHNTQNIRDVSCIGVPFYRVPDFPVPYIIHLDMVESGLEVLEANVMSTASTIESARFMNNRISHIDDNAFRAHFSSSLKSLDLSYNSLSTFPLEALSRLKALDWLNLHNNEISEISIPPGSYSSYSNLKASLSTLFLGNNDFIEVPANFFTDFKRLLWLNFDDNHLRTIPPHVLPASLLTLSLANNLISKFPFESVNHLPSLTWFTIRGNHIEAIPTEPFQYFKRLDKLDMGENFITAIPMNMFNGTLNVNDLNLDYNYIERIRRANFRTINPRRIYLGMNRISEIEPDAFAGLEGTLELVDLEGNRLNNVSWAFGELQQLRYLYLSNNNISSLAPDVMSKFCHTLRALSVSGNILDRFPRQSLENCRELSHLNIGYNNIRELSVADFSRWADKLDTLILRSNLLSHLAPHIFRGCPHLRELSLSFNAFVHIDAEAFRDIGTSLESLEISFGLRTKVFPEAAIKPLQKLLWLSLDNNEIEQISETALYNHGELQYLNLESNRLTRLPKNLLHQNVHKQLLDVRMSYNHLGTIESGTFSALPRLQTVVLSGNKIKFLANNSFRHLPNLVTLIISHNHINTIEAQAFVHLDNLQKLELQFNKLTEFSLNSFENCTKYPMHAMTLNISHNLIQSLSPMNNDRVPFIETLDSSHNRLESVPRAFLEFLAPSLRTLDLSYNQLPEIERVDFKQLALLQVLKVSHNQILDLAKTAFHSLTGLQILDLSSNRIEVLQFSQFMGLSGLRRIDLSNNRLRSLPRDVFQSTALESVDLSINEFVAMPTSALTEASATLRHLNLSYNRIEHVDSTMFSNTPHLISLSLAHNKLTILPDNIFIGLGSLTKLDLSYNPIRANYKELFHYVQRLKDLSLAHVDIQTLPMFTLPQLTRLDVSANRMDDLPYSNSEGLPQLRHLNVSRNQFTHLPSHAWHYLPQLKSLDVSWNPLRVLTKESFYGLLRLQDLTVQYLPDLLRFDADSLAQISYLKRLNIQSWPSIEKFKFRLGSVVSGLPSLRMISARILEPSGVLTDQILGAFGPKLKELEITGPLKRLTLDAFEGIESYELLLTIRDTELHELPKGFHSMFKNVVHFSLDLRDNKLETFAPDALYQNGSAWQRTGTRILQGGLALQGNPWKCSCENVWLGEWLRRWMRETLQLHTSVVERGQTIQSIVRSISCLEPDQPDQMRSLVELDDNVKCYKEAEVSASSGMNIKSSSIQSRTLTLIVLASWTSWTSLVRTFWMGCRIDG
ncbi:chaoptin-like isoform X2 [Tigriopus californicus]|nr:chaoptin-like isoform X2 [Tigriopus californicus]